MFFRFPTDRRSERDLVGTHPILSDSARTTCLTLADHIQAVVDAGCRIVKVDEHGKKIEDEFWMEANLDKLPAYLMIVGRKQSPNKTAGGDA